MLSNSLVFFGLVLQVQQEFVCLRVEAGFLQIEETFEWICPGQSSGTGREERLGMMDRVHHDIGGLEGVLNGLKRRVKLGDKA